MGEESRALNGVICFHSETGTEGGFWAFQDEHFISKVPPRYGVWGDEVVWDSANPQRSGKARNDGEVLRNGAWHPIRDPMYKDPDFCVSSLFLGEEKGDREADKRLMEKYGFTIKYSADWIDEMYGKGNWYLEDSSTAVTPDGTRIIYGGTPETEPNRPHGVGAGDLTRVTIEWEDGVVEQRLSDSLLMFSWSYEGLHILNNGDQLVIYDKNNRSNIMWSGTIQLREYELFTQDAFGYWIHADQEGIDRETWARWFLDEHPAQLTPAKPED